MATSKITFPKYRFTTFTIDCTTSMSGKYVAAYTLSDEEWGDAVAAIPLYARKSGQGVFGEMCIEGKTIRLQFSASTPDVNVGVLMIS